jgi:hypothetical protein
LICEDGYYYVGSTEDLTQRIVITPLEKAPATRNASAVRFSLGTSPIQTRRARPLVSAIKSAAVSGQPIGQLSSFPFPQFAV